MRYSRYTDWQAPQVHRQAKNPLREKQNEPAEYKPAQMGPNGTKGGRQTDGEVMIAEPEVSTKRPSFYKVILLNDDFTPMDFVVTVLEQIFRKTHEEAINLMLMVHTKGAAMVGVFTRDVAETKVDQVIEYARINDYPLQCVIEKE